MAYLPALLTAKTIENKVAANKPRLRASNEPVPTGSMRMYREPSHQLMTMIGRISQKIIRQEAIEETVPPYVGPKAGASEITIPAKPVIEPIRPAGILLKIMWNIRGVDKPVAMA